jgi:hypothetical protein
MRSKPPRVIRDRSVGQIPDERQIANARFEAIGFWKRALTFHEKADRCQGILWLSKFIS